MAQVLKPIKLTRTHLSLGIESDSFHSGFVEGLCNTTRRFDLSGNPEEKTIVDILTNLIDIALENGSINADLVRHDAGLIAGYLSRY